MEKMRKEIIFTAYGILIILLSLIGYFVAKNNKIEYGAGGALIGVLLSLILWITWWSKNIY